MAQETTAGPSPAGGFRVPGRIVNGTAGSVVPEGLSVRIVAFQEGNITEAGQAVTAPDGSWLAENVQQVPGATYVAAADYQEATYLAQLQPGTAPVELTIYDVSSVNPGLRFDQSALVYSLPEDGLQALTVTEIHSVVNTSDRTFLPRADGPGGPEGLLVFGLPPDASDVRPLRGLEPGRLIQIGRGFASLSQVNPGRSEISFSYRVPYSDEALRVDRTIRYPADTVRILAPASGPKIDSAQLPTATSVTIAGRQYQTREGGPFPVGAPIAVMLSDLPLPGGVLARVPPAAAAGAGLLVGLLVLTLYLRRTPRRDSMVQDGLDDELLERALQLDLDLREGRLTEADYQAARGELIAEARSSLHESQSAPGMGS